MANPDQQPRGFIASLKKALTGTAEGRPGPRRRPVAPEGVRAARRDQLAPFVPPALDLDPLIHPTKHHHPSVPHSLHPGTLLVSQRHGAKCILLEPVENVDVQVIKGICLRRSGLQDLVYLPVGTSVLKDEILHQGRDLVLRLRKGTLFLSPGGHPDGYLLEPLTLPLTREVSSNPEILLLTEATAHKNLQRLVDIPPSFAMAKEDLLYEEAGGPRLLAKGTLIVSRSGALSGFLLEDVALPLTKSVADLDALFALKTTYNCVPLETLIQQSARAGSQGLPIDRGTFLFSPQGKVYFVWKEDVKATTQRLKAWARAAQIVEPGILNVSTTSINVIGGPGEVVTQDEINYLHDVFRQAGSTNIRRDTLLLDRNVFFKFTQEMPYAHTGRFRSYLNKGVVMLNTFRKGTFSVELGGKDITITDLDLQQIRQRLQPTGKILIKISTLLRVRDERHGDWVYRVKNNLFYPYDTFTRPYLEEFIPEYVAFEKRAEKTSTLIGPQAKPYPEDIGASGEPIGDLLALVNNELANERTVFVLDQTLFHWRGRLYRVNEELVFRPQLYTKIAPQDMDALEAEWKVHPLVTAEGGQEEDEEAPRLAESEEGIDDLPFDTSPRA
ncbi:MAG: hypothetical protein AB1505_06200 [Candidatus Latescibacterota bacterium]